MMDYAGSKSAREKFGEFSTNSYMKKKYFREVWKDHNKIVETKNAYIIKLSLFKRETDIELFTRNI